MASRKEQDEEFKKIMSEVLAARDDLKKTRSPLPIYFAGLFIIMLMIVWLVPLNSFPVRAKLSDVPTLEEIAPQLSIGERPDSSNINAYIKYDDASIKLIAAKVVTSACSKEDKTCYANALFYFVQEEITYLSDPLGEYYETPQETLLAQAADCDGQAILYASLLRSVGILTQFSYSPNHVAVEAWLPTTTLFSKSNTYGWEYYDPTCKQCKPGQRMV